MLAVIASDAGRTPRRCQRRTQATPWRLALSTLRICGSTSLMRMSVRCCWPATLRRPPLWPNAFASEAADLPGAAQLLGPAIVGRAALGAGHLDTACVSLDQAAVALFASGYAMGWGFRYQVPRATALAMRGSVDGRRGLASLETVRRPFRLLDYERSLARGWVFASQGAVSAAVTELLSAAQRAAQKGRFAAEVLCLQTATQFGDRSSAPRLARA